MNYLKSSVAAGLALAAAGAFAQAPTTATIAQTGTGNQAFVEQRQAGEDATVSIVQTGNYNVIGDPAAQSGGVLLSETPRMIVEISQLGDANRLTLQHREGGFFGFSYIHQSGTGNSTSLLQNGAYESTIRVEQHGERNVIEDQANGVLAHSFRPVQQGTDNVISVSRTLSGYGGLPITQAGADNRAFVTLDNAYYSSMIISQDGTGNEARGSMTATGFATDAYITQNGMGNIAVTDIRESCGAVTTQTGNQNTATVSQTDGSNSATITQIGALNTASTMQSGGTYGMTNTAWITQVGDGFASSVTQTGSANSAGIHQH